MILKLLAGLDLVDRSIEYRHLVLVVLVPFWLLLSILWLELQLDEAATRKDNSKLFLLLDIDYYVTNMRCSSYVLVN